MQVGKTGGEEGKGRGGIAINLAASFAPYDGDEMMARFKRYEFFVFFYSVLNLKNVKNST